MEIELKNDKRKKFTIIGHSIGCLTAMYINDQIPSENLQNLVCLGAPLTTSPT
jgi:triacylglycerol esterase/lipase EstA (alpha/beta hydrolase family)